MGNVQTININTDNDDEVSWSAEELE